MFQLPKTFHLHDRQRSAICMAAFFFLCVAPTATVLAWGAWIRLPWHADWAAEQLSQSLGLDVSLADIRHPRPGRTVLEGLKVVDPETDVVLLRCDLVEAFRADPTDPESPAEGALSLVLHAPEADAAALERAVELVHRVLERRTAWSQEEVRWQADTLRLQSPGAVHELSDVAGCLRPVDGGSVGQISFHHAAMTESKRVRIQLGRDRRDSPPRTGMELATGDGLLPCSLLSLAWPALARLGPDAALGGSLWINQKPDGWTYTLAGRLTGVDLAAVLPDHCPHRMTGTAQIDVEMARALNGRLLEAAGTIRCGPGTIGRSLLEASVATLGLVPGATPREPSETIHYTALAAGFQIDAEGLRLRDLCQAPLRTAIAVDAAGTLLSEPDPQQQPVPIAALVQTLAPATQSQIPLTPGAEHLLSVLPIPAHTPPPAARTAVLPRVDLGEPFEQR